MTFSEVSNVKSYNVKLNPDGGVKHVAAANLVNGIGTAVFTKVQPGNYTACIKLQAQSTQFTDECLVVTVVGTEIMLLPQTVVMDPIADKVYGDEPFTVSATGGASGNPVTFTASGDCTVEEDVVTILAAGSCTITAEQEGGEGYSAAPSVSQSFTIAPKGLTISISPAAASRTFGQANPSCSYTVDGVVGTENFSVSCDWTNATATTPVGSNVPNSYAITCHNGCVRGNYSFTIPIADLTIVAYACTSFSEPVGNMPITRAPVKLGSNVPVKFICYDTNNQPIRNLTATLVVSGPGVNGQMGTFSLSDATRGQYQHNLNTSKVPGFQVGGQYGLYAHLNDGSIVSGGITMAAK